jgi:alkylation response protein AidB-like acyl-CoA dehydrogenase
MTAQGDPMFDLFQLPEEHQELRAAIRGLAEKEIAPHAADVDEHARFPQEALEALNASGFNAVHIPEDTAVRARIRWQPASSSKRLREWTVRPH